MTEAVAAIGHNNPPEKTPFDEVSEKIDGLFAEAKGWLDGEPVATQGQADELNKLINLITEAEKEAEALRKAENQPFDEGKAEVQARYNALTGKTKSVTGKTVLAKDAAKKALTPWLERLDREKREAEAKARAVEEAAARAAEEARRNAAADDLAAREEVERLEKEAKKAQANAKAASKDTANAKGGTGRATSLRTYYRAEVTDLPAFAKWMWNRQHSWMAGFFTEAADKLVAENPNRPIDGVTIHEERKAV